MKKTNFNKIVDFIKNSSIKVGKKKVNLFLIIFSILFLNYSYNCTFEKVCGINILNKLVRQNVTISALKGDIKSEVVNTKKSRELGLSGRGDMKNNEGMLFVFDHSGRYGFWMKDMKFPLDILWINQDGFVVSLETNFTPESYFQNPPKTYINGPEAIYVLELKAGEAEKHGIYLGSKLKIQLK